jgi:hypothetical protein
MFRTGARAGRVVTVALCGLLGLSACNTQAQWTYPVEPSTLYHAARAPSNLAVAVLPFKEERPLVNRSATYWLYMIPGFPFGWATYERPEAARMFNTIAEFGFQMDEDLGKAATRSLEDSHLFRRAYFTLGGELSEADLVLRGSTRRTRYYGRLITYCLSLYGPVLWLIGLPAGTSTNDVSLAFSLQDKTNHELWSYAYSGSASTTQGLYYNFGNDAVNFEVLTQEAMNAALAQLETQLDQIEAAYDQSD